MKPSVTVRPAAAAAAAISSTCSARSTSDFSHSTCLPASRAAIAMSACVSPGVQTSTRSTSSRVSSAFQSVSTDRHPSLSAAAPAFAASRPHSTARSGATGRSKNRPAVRHAWECAAPMKE